MKILDFDDLAKNEIGILMKLDHDNIIKYYNHFEVKLKTDKINELLKFFIITELCKVFRFLFNFYNLIVFSCFLI